ncbi:thioredoxin family protein [Myroides pelagicus]|uniref:Thioredoxin family protein n=1 Tax=Myroides pelagicus TaxID=270914 RepID=A0A7K1GJN4_9FLAO|nr:thioredoxin family protein [Myroides pelagicus]MEC4112823.1 thioredoxin family protein [Myroides pelagicus]MTH28633.1 thioredoxin family protein [Myroides pelagicus]
MIHINSKTIEKSFSYTEFRAFVTDSLANNVDALELNDDYLAYAKLNEARLHRLDKTLKASEESAFYLNNLDRKVLWIAITESWCGDAAQSVPMLNKLAELSDNVELKLVLRDKNLDLMDQFLTNGGRAIPKLLIVDKQSLEVLADWGPRPTGARTLIEDYKKEHGVVDETCKIELQKWYTKDKGHEVEKEVIDLMKSVL